MTSSVKRPRASLADLTTTMRQADATEAPHAEPIPVPILSDGARVGLAGDILAVIEPENEGAPVAILVQFLAAFGNAAGRAPHYVAGAAEHYVNLFTLIIGRTAGGRKGTSWAAVNQLMKLADDVWTEHNVMGGLSSGEGLMSRVRDAVPAESGERRATDAGVADKRVFILESEFAAALKVMRREGNTLSPILRSFWESGNARSLTKNSPLTATGAHVSVTGHITREELARQLDGTEIANGFLNRFLLVVASRSKYLPEGGDLSEAKLRPLARRVREALDFARKTGEMYRDTEAAQLWATAYRPLSDGHAGMLGKVTSRAEAQVLRLSCLYALLDLSDVVRRPHLEAALALWAYCLDSAKYVFGESLGDPMADKLLAYLRSRPEGATRTEINDGLFKGDKSAKDIAEAQQTLADAGLAWSEKTATTGAPVTRWFAARVPTLVPPNPVNPLNPSPVTAQQAS